MLTIKASAKPSNVEGIGLFADEKIIKGTTMWKYDPRFDISFTEKEVEEMTPLQQTFIDRYAYLSPQMRKYILPIDDSRFTNHSSKHANEDVVLFPGEIETRGVAHRDIESGEEILVNYRLFDANDAKSDEAYLAN